MHFYYILKSLEHRILLESTLEGNSSAGFCHFSTLLCLCSVCFRKITLFSLSNTNKLRALVPYSSGRPTDIKILLCMSAVTKTRRAIQLKLIKLKPGKLSFYIWEPLRLYLTLKNNGHSLVHVSIIQKFQILFELPTQYTNTASRESYSTTHYSIPISYVQRTDRILHLTVKYVNNDILTLTVLNL